MLFALMMVTVQLEPSSAHRPRRLARPRTPPFHGDNMGSNPIGDTNDSTVTDSSLKLAKNELVDLGSNTPEFITNPNGKSSFSNDERCSNVLFSQRDSRFQNILS